MKFGIFSVVENETKWKQTEIWKNKHKNYPSWSFVEWMSINLPDGNSPLYLN